MASPASTSPASSLPRHTIKVKSRGCLCQRALLSHMVIFAVGLLIGASVMYVCATQSDSESVQQSSNFRPLKRTVRSKVLGINNFTYVLEIDLEVLKQMISNFLQMVEEVYFLLSNYSVSEISSLKQELLQTIHQLELEVKTGVSNIAKIKESLIPKERQRPSLEGF